MWYYRFAGQLLTDSFWGKIKLFQENLATTLGNLGLQTITADGKYGNLTRQGIVRLCAHPQFQDLQVPQNDPHFGAISTDLWARLMTAGSAPSVHERAFVISLSHEGTDYNKAEWNLDTSDNDSVLTWGPYGATVGHGREVQAILRRVEQRDAQLLPAIFDAGPRNEFATLRQLLNGANGEATLRPAFQNATRKQHWRESFAELGPIAMVREEYEAYAFETDNWFRPAMRRLYRRLIPNPDQRATAVDYGFFLDIAMHMSVTDARLDRAADAIADRENDLGRPLNPAERRQVISRNFIPSNQVADRRGRNVVYFVDGVGEAALSEEERTAWQQRTGRKASHCGLTDDTLFVPPFV